MKATKAFDRVFPVRQIAVRAIAAIARAAQGFISLAAQINVGCGPLPNITVLFEPSSFAGRRPLLNRRQAPAGPAAVGRGFVKIHQNDGIVLLASGVAAVVPVLRRRIARCENKLEVFAVRDFAGIKCRGCDKKTGKKNAQR